jgi:hypothetical protein
LIQPFLPQQVVINNKLEQRIIGVINEHKKQSNDKGVISGRLTAKKLQVISKNYFFKFHNFSGAFFSPLGQSFTR